MPADQRVSVRDAAIRQRNRQMMNRPTRSAAPESTSWSAFAKGFIGLILVIGTIAAIAVASSGGEAAGGAAKVSKNSGEGLNTTNVTDVDVDVTDSPTTSTLSPTKSPQTGHVGWGPIPTAAPTSGTASPTGTTTAPSSSPTTSQPTGSPSNSPTMSPTTPAPTGATGTPSASPTTSEPTGAPTSAPSSSPSSSPTASPSMAPTGSPTSSPTLTSEPSASPTSTPSQSPSLSPTDHPSTSPTSAPSCATLIRLSNIEPDPLTGVPPAGFVALPIATGYGVAGVRKLMKFNTGNVDVKVTRVWLWLVGTSEEQDITVQIVTADAINVTNGTIFENVETRVNLGNETPPFTTEDVVTNFNYEFIPTEIEGEGVLDLLEANTTYYLSVAGTENAGAEWNVKCLNDVVDPCEPDTEFPSGEFEFEGALRNTLTEPEIFTIDPVLNGFAIEATCDD